MSSNQTTFEAQHPVLCYTMKSAKILFSTVLSILAQQAGKKIADYCTQGTSAVIEDLLFTQQESDSSQNIAGGESPFCPLNEE